MSLFARLQPVIASTLKVEPALVTPATTDEDIPAQWDSMGQVNLVMALEESFGVYIEPEQFDQLKSVPAILAFLEAQGVG